MSEFFRKYWFVCLIAVALIAGLGYYVADLNKDNVSARKVDGKDVVASVSLGDVTSDEIFDDYQNFNSSLLYNMYQTAVVDQSVEATSDMKTQAKTMARNIKANMDSDNTGKARFSVISELASYGFEGEDSLQDYCLYALKAKAMDKDYILDHYDEYKDTLTTSPRTVSIITMEVGNPDELTEDEQSKQDSINKALENGDSFADTATAFSEDVNTAAKSGYYGYIDSSTTDLDSAVVEAATALDAGKYSEWITVKDSTSGANVLYLVYVDETDPKAILESDNSADVDAIVSAYVKADSTIEGKAVAKAAESLDITFDNDDVKAKLDTAIATATGADAQDESESAESGQKEDENSDQPAEAGDDTNESNE